MDLQEVERFDPHWQRSCLRERHNLTCRGERELRGERHGKGGRSFFETIASSFFICLLFFLPSAGPASGQVRFQLSAGFGGSGIIVRDAIATPVLRAMLGQGVDEQVEARFTPAPGFGAGVEVPLRPGTAVVVTGSWSSMKIRAQDGSGTRDIQDVTMLQGIFGMRRRLGRIVEAGGGVGVVFFSGEDRALLAGGASAAPLLEAGAGGGWNAGAHRVHVRALGQLHRFGTGAITAAGGRSGNVMRYGVEAAFTWKGAVPQ
jgi:hypothetical protein